MGNKLEKGAVRRLICRLDVLYILPRTSTMIFFFHNGKNSRNRGVLEELCGLGWKENLCFLDIVLIANDQVGVFGLFVVILLGLWNHIGGVSNFTVRNFKILHNFLSWCGIEIDLFLKSYFGMWVYLDWRSCDINVKINVKIGFLLIRFSRAQLYPWLNVLYVVAHVSPRTFGVTNTTDGPTVFFLTHMHHLVEILRISSPFGSIVLTTMGSVPVLTHGNMNICHESMNFFLLNGVQTFKQVWYIKNENSVCETRSSLRLASLLQNLNQSFKLLHCRRSEAHQSFVEQICDQGKCGQAVKNFNQDLLNRFNT
ncbi:hypothetical protein YC2023_059995 [Brassica napus]